MKRLHAFLAVVFLYVFAFIGVSVSVRAETPFGTGCGPQASVRECQTSRFPAMGGFIHDIRHSSWVTRDDVTPACDEGNQVGSVIAELNEQGYVFVDLKDTSEIADLVVKVKTAEFIPVKLDDGFDHFDEVLYIVGKGRNTGSHLFVGFSKGCVTALLVVKDPA